MSSDIKEMENVNNKEEIAADTLIKINDVLPKPVENYPTEQNIKESEGEETTKQNQLNESEILEVVMDSNFAPNLEKPNNEVPNLVLPPEQEQEQAQVVERSTAPENLHQTLMKMTGEILEDPIGQGILNMSEMKNPLEGQSSVTLELTTQPEVGKNITSVDDVLETSVNLTEIINDDQQDRASASVQGVEQTDEGPCTTPEVQNNNELVEKVSETEENKSTEQIEPLEASDSQDSIKLIIDEAHLTDTHTETETAVNTKQLEDEGNQLVEGEEENNTTIKDDDDVIHVAEPAVPIIEIDDDDELMEVENFDKCNVLSSKTAGGPNTSSELKNDITDVDANVEDNTEVNVPEMSKELDQVNDEVADDNLLGKLYEKSLEEIVKEKKANEAEECEDPEIYYKKECVNHECQKQHKQYLRAPLFALNYFHVNKKKFKAQYVCLECYDTALDMYEEFCGLLDAKQPLLLENITKGRPEFVEIIDSSDEEETCTLTKPGSDEQQQTTFSESNLSLIEQELDNCIQNVLNRVDIQSQLTWSKTILSERLKNVEKDCVLVDAKLRGLQRKADRMHEALYQCPKIKVRPLPPLDLNSGRPFHTVTEPQVQSVPPAGELERPAVQINGVYYAVKNNAIARWVPCKVVEQVDANLTTQKTVKHYKIKFLKSQYQMFKTVPIKHLAFYEPPHCRLPIGTRVIAYFDASSLSRGKEKVNVQSAFYPGIIAEPLKPNNKYRYLIFYDDGYTQYVYHKDVRLVCHVSENVWEDVHPASRDFIQKYLTQYSINRPMVQTQKGQSMSTQSNGYWLHARVVDIDCSLVLMQFEGTRNHTEWIYRGSLRLGPVYKEYQKSLQKTAPAPVSRLPRRTEPFIRYTQDEDTSSQPSSSQAEKTRSVARKTFGRPDSMTSNSQVSAQMPVKTLNNSTIYVEDENKPKGKVVYYTAKRNLPPLRFKPHICTPACLFEITHNLSAYSPLSKPLLSGWERLFVRQKVKKTVAYRGPCGRILRNMKELHYYLRVTQNVLNVDNFDFSPETNCLAEYVIASAIVQKRDISGGQEKMAIPLVNYYDNTVPPECRYSAKVIPTEGVHINTDVEFLVGCDCDDDCSDKSRCSCWQLTLAGAKYGNPNTPPHEVGYQYKRLLEHVPTGIYECNARCKCKSNCLNRVVQHSLQMKLQVFKTSNRGWGLRCVNDIPRGSFICIYAGHLLTEAKANEGGLDAGDEYFAELDYIEVAEQIKEGYESDVEPPEPEDDIYNPDPEDDDDFTPSKSYMSRSKAKLRNARQFEDEFQERQVISFNPNIDMNEESVRESSMRKLFGRDEACYVMDAKITGNLGRYFNHSCSPNLFVQSVFVDTHDLRFPWVAFFSSCHITSGTELTWNYNYEVGVVPGKVLYCQCGAPNCRQRLL